MANTSVPTSPKEATSEVVRDYVWRGRGLFETYRDELQYLGAGVWLVPSGSESGKVYEVRVGTTRRRSRCECVGYQHHEHCSHLVCAEMAHNKSAVCDDCGQRSYWPELVEVTEDHDSLTWFPGDVLCRACAGGHGL